MSSHSAEFPSNFAGTVIFISYVVAALCLTAFLAYDLSSAYLSLTSSHLSRRTGRSTISSHVYTFLTLAILSFSVLSYHMLNFLILSYGSWAGNRNIPVPYSPFGPQGLVGYNRTRIHVWQWLTGSTLFLDFAKEICATWSRYWWTSQALWATTGVYCFMAFHGTWCPVTSDLTFPPPGLGNFTPSSLNVQIRVSNSEVYRLDLFCASSRSFMTPFANFLPARLLLLHLQSQLISIL